MSKMIVIRLQGGLGNQLFQYAMGKAFQLRNQLEVKYDFSYFNKQQEKDGISRWPYELENFKTQVYKANKLHEIIFRTSNKLSLPFGKVYKDTVHNLSTKTDFLGLKSGYFDGYWQSAGYFEDFKEDIIRDYELATPLDKNNQKIINKIQSVNSVSIHVRRGDFMHSSVQGFINNPLTYYHKAIEDIGSKVSKPHFFAFSDDLVWLKNNIKIDFPIEYINVNTGKDSFKDMVLMSKCKHNIIANSTFSWWGTYLNQNKDKIVFAPKDWGKANLESIKCPNWILL